MVKNHKNYGRRTGLQSVTLCISTAMVLILLGLIVFFALGGRNLFTHVKENLVVTMMLQQDMSDNEATTLCQSIAKKPYIKSYNYISKAQALKIATKELGTNPTEFTDGVNPYLSEIDVTLKSDYANNDSLRWISQDLKRYSKVSEITYSKDLVEVVNRNLTKIGIVLLVLAVLLTFVSFTLINNTVRLGIYARRFSIHTMKLVGASWGFIRWPFVRRAMVIGLIAAILAIAVLAGCIYALYCSEPEMTSIISWRELTVTAITVLCFGLFLTAICASISVNKFLRMKAGELYKI